MKQWISRVVSAYEREPGLCLFAASVVLAVLFWHLPVPPFLFADPGSGSATPCQCKFPQENCESWQYVGKAVDGFTAWEAIEPDTLRKTCATTDKLMGISNFYYEAPGLPFCTNAGSCQHAPPAPPRKHRVDRCLSQWKRTVVIDKDGELATERDIHFLPVVSSSFHGFSAGGLCPNVDGRNSLEFQSGAFAKMKVCNEEVKDKREEDGEVGWAFNKQVFKKVEGVWDFVPSEKWKVNFNVVKKKCQCLQVTNAEQFIAFMCHVTNNKVGGNPVKMDREAWIEFSIAKDTTTCELAKQN